MSEPIPVLMYHSVAPVIKDWAFNYLSMHPDVFENHLSVLESSGYVSVSLSELHDYVSGKGRLPPRAVVLTFDDGYLDSWVFAFPILRKHGFKATVFVSTDFIDRRRTIRNNLADVWESRCRYEDLEWRGFLSEEEMRRMLSSDLIDIEAHGKTHTWYFVSRKIVDYHHPGDAYPWLAWNRKPDRKYLYLEEDQAGFVPFGSPVYEHRKAMTARRYFPDPRIENELAQQVARNGGRGFFEKPDWRDQLNLLSNEIASKGLDDRTETPDERGTRLREEIILSRQELELATGHPIRFLCWPGGDYDDTAIDMARRAGYTACTFSSREAGPWRNFPGEDPFRIRRIAAVPYWYYKGRKICPVNGEFLKLILDNYKGYPLSRARLKWHKLCRLMQAMVSAPSH
jgi:peptidoglycan/xylan/chitin deacetylase (PgdA/CDA1 family)